MNEPKQVPEPSAERIGCNICGEALPDGEPHLCSEPQGEPSDARIDEANQILARIVSAANKGPLEGGDGFILGYQMSVGPIHAAIPFLQKQGIVVTTSGEIRTAVTEQGENR